MAACTPAYEDHPGSSDAGFSLIELVVSLSIIALIIGLVVPNGIRMVERYEAYRSVEAIRIVAQSKKQEAIARNRLIRIDSADLAELAEQNGIRGNWTIEMGSPMTFSPAGVCSGSDMTVRRGTDAVFLYRLDQSSCTLVKADATT